ncbi:MAG: pyruvate kinase [Pirellulales bacterium]|nr:pyruvate kinase [Pirellulales bacterium]
MTTATLPLNQLGGRLNHPGTLMDEYQFARDHRQMARTKIVATVGPSCREPDQLAALVEAGADVFRLNMAHGGPEETQELVSRIRQVSEQLNQPLAILVDLSGPKFRLGDLQGESIKCRRDEEFYFVTGEPAAPNELTTSYEPLVRELSPGDRVMLADGTVSMVVEETDAARVRMRVVQSGIIRSRQGINLPGVRVSAPAISVDDHHHAIWAAKAGVDFVSLSFVRSPDEVRTLKDILRSSGSEARVIAKIEKREALERLNEIVAEADGVMVARGDLGVEIDVAQMPLEQKRIIRTCQDFHKPVIIATQMLDSMHDSPRPKRAEVTDVANAVLDGAAACMLSGETAIGNYPTEAVAMMKRIALATETSMAGQPLRESASKGPDGLHAVTSAVVRGAGTMAHGLEAKLVVVASHSGRTALALSQQRSFVPTVGISAKESTLRQMCLYWGVTPLPNAPANDVEQLIRHTDHWSVHSGFASRGDRIVIVGGSHLAAGPKNEQLASGVHDIVIVHEVEGSMECAE